MALQWLEVWFAAILMVLSLERYFGLRWRTEVTHSHDTKSEMLCKIILLLATALPKMVSNLEYKFHNRDNNTTY